MSRVVYGLIEAIIVYAIYSTLKKVKKKRLEVEQEEFGSEDGAEIQS